MAAAPRPRLRIRWIIISLVGVVIALLVWQAPLIGLGIAAATAETRPALLSDADWDDAASAKMFGLRFHAGVPERELLDWLEASRFTVDRAGRHAEHRIMGLPCNEVATISWAANADGRLREATALVREAGCL